MSSFISQGNLLKSRLHMPFFVLILHWRLNGHLLFKRVKTRHLFLDRVRRGVGLFSVCRHMLFFLCFTETSCDADQFVTLNQEKTRGPCDSVVKQIMLSFP